MKRQRTNDGDRNESESGKLVGKTLEEVLEERGRCTCGREMKLAEFHQAYLRKLETIKTVPKYQITEHKRAECDKDSGSGFGCYAGCACSRTWTVDHGKFQDFDSALEFYRKSHKGNWCIGWELRRFNPSTLKYEEVSRYSDECKKWDKVHEEEMNNYWNRK